MNPSITPEAHPDPWLELLRGYVGETVRALAEGGLRPRGSWLDPRDPRDATILLDGDGLAPVRALVWDEETGWRTGTFVDGRQGVRTELAEAAHLGGGVLVHPSEVAGRLRAGTTGPGERYRSYHASHDGLDDALRAY